MENIFVENWEKAFKIFDQYQTIIFETVHYHPFISKYFIRGDKTMKTKAEKILTINDIVSEKMHILYDMCLLHGEGKKRDPREAQMEEILLSKTENQIDNLMHDLIIGNKTIAQVLNQYKGGKI